MNRNNRGFMDAITNLQQMGEQMSKMFGGDFARQWMGGSGQPPGRPSANNRQGPGSGPTNTFNGWPGIAPQGGGFFPDWLRGMPGLDGLANMWGTGVGTQNPASVFPPVDVYESDHEVFVICDVPGVDRPAGIQVSIQSDRVVLRGQIRSRSADNSGVAPSLSERRTGSFERVIDLPAAVDRSRARAVYKDGQLELRLPKLRGSKGQSGQPIPVDFL